MFAGREKEASAASLSIESTFSECHHVLIAEGPNLSLRLAELTPLKPIFTQG